MTAARNRTQHARADMLVHCHEALHLRTKLQGAGYVQKPVKWDSDSDSDETDEEGLGCVSTCMSLCPCVLRRF